MRTVGNVPARVARLLLRGADARARRASECLPVCQHLLGRPGLLGLEGALQLHCYSLTRAPRGGSARKYDGWMVYSVSTLISRRRCLGCLGCAVLGAGGRRPPHHIAFHRGYSPPSPFRPRSSIADVHAPASVPVVPPRMHRRNLCSHAAPRIHYLSVSHR